MAALDKDYTLVVNDKAVTEKKSRSLREMWEVVQGRFDWDWLDRAIVGTSYENTALSIWRNQPNLRISTEKLASYITPRWPAAGCPAAGPRRHAAGCRTAAGQP